MKKALTITLVILFCAFAVILLLIGLRYGSTAPPTAVVEARSVGVPFSQSDRDARASALAEVTLPDLVYFGAAWQMLNKNVGMAPIALGGGYANARVERTSDGLFFAGIVEKLDRDDNVTDVVLAFAGAQGSGDFIQGESLAYGRVLGEPKWAAVLFERIWQDPRYAKARIHVTGHSLGAGYAIFVGMEAIVRHGQQAVMSRLRITAFGVPNWGPQSGKYFGVRSHALDGIFTGYTALNDPVITNGGTDRVGVSHFLPAFTGLTGFSSMFNAVAAHWPTTYMTGLGLPDWLTSGQKSASIQAVSAMFISGHSYDPKYGPAGVLPMIIQGSATADVISGTARNDLIAGRGGRDVLSGGGGHDRFVYLDPSDSGPAPDRMDHIQDFGPGDRLDLSRMDADISRPERQSFTLTASRSFTMPGQVSTWSDGMTTWVAGNVDNDDAADFLIAISGDHHLSKADFVLAPLGTDQRFTRYIDGKAAILQSR